MPGETVTSRWLLGQCTITGTYLDARGTMPVGDLAHGDVSLLMTDTAVRATILNPTKVHYSDGREAPREHRVALLFSISMLELNRILGNRNQAEIAEISARDVPLELIRLRAASRTTDETWLEAHPSDIPAFTTELFAAMLAARVVHGTPEQQQAAHEFAMKPWPQRLAGRLAVEVRIP